MNDIERWKRLRRHQSMLAPTEDDLRALRALIRKMVAEELKVLMAEQDAAAPQ